MLNDLVHNESRALFTHTHMFEMFSRRHLLYQRDVVSFQRDPPESLFGFILDVHFLGII